MDSIISQGPFILLECMTGFIAFCIVFGIWQAKHCHHLWRESENYEGMEKCISCQVTRKMRGFKHRHKIKTISYRIKDDLGKTNAIIVESYCTICGQTQISPTFWTKSSEIVVNQKVKLLENDSNRFKGITDRYCEEVIDTTAKGKITTEGSSTT